MITTINFIFIICPVGTICRTIGLLALAAFSLFTVNAILTNILPTFEVIVTKVCVWTAITAIKLLAIVQAIFLFTNAAIVQSCAMDAVCSFTLIAEVKEGATVITFTTGIL